MKLALLVNSVSGKKRGQKILPRLMAALPRLCGGTHVELPQVSCFKARHVSVKTTPTQTLLPDGDVFGSTPAEFNLIRHGVRFLA